LAALGIVAFLLASGTSEMIAAEVSKMLPSTAPSPVRTNVSRHHTNSRFTRPDGSDILKRNIFDSEMGPIVPFDATENDMDDLLNESNKEGLPLVPCTSQLKLLATVASSNDPEWSFANVSSGRETNLYRMGDALDGRVVSGITWRYLLLRGSVDECYIDLFGDPNAKPKKPPMRSPQKITSNDDIKNGITVDGPNERTVDRSVVDQALANPTMFARSVRVRPYKKNGEVVGFRLRRIKKGSPLELLGAKKGDIIHSVNGVNLTGVDQALIAYQSLRSENKLVFSLTRRGKPVTLNINIR